MNKVLGIDIGGTHITAALIDIKRKKIIEESRQRASVNSKGAADDILNEWAFVIRTALGESDFSERKIGIAMPGPFNYDEGISLMKDNAKYSSLYEINVKEQLGEMLGIPCSNIFFRNDAVCFLKGELFAGVAQGFNRAIGITLGTGLGTTYFDGENVTDANLWCMPFKNNIAEEYISTRWFINRYHQLTGKTAIGVKQLAENYESDCIVRDLFDEFTTNLASFIKLFLDKCPSDLVVLGGNILNAEDLFLPTLKEKLGKLQVKINVVRSVLSEDAALLGAVG